MNWPLARLIVGWTLGIGIALASWRVPPLPKNEDSWVARLPLRTAGCPGLLPQLAAWQRELTLADWTIEIECGPSTDYPGYLGRVLSHSDVKRAEIWIRDGMSRGLQSSVVVHELVHVGVAAHRWWVPEGQEEEPFVDESSWRVYTGRARELHRRMVREAKRRGRDGAAVTSPEATVHAARVAAPRAG